MFIDWFDCVLQFGRCTFVYFSRQFKIIFRILKSIIVKVLMIMSIALMLLDTTEQPTSQEPQPMSQEPQPTSKDPQQTTVPLNLDPNTSPESKDHQDPAIHNKLTTEESVDPEDSWTPCDDALLLSNVQTFFYDDYEEGNEGEVSGTTGLTATNENLSKVLPDGPIERRADHPTTLIVPNGTKPVHTQSNTFFPPTMTQLAPTNNTQYTTPPTYSPNPPPTYSPNPPPTYSPQPVNYSSYQSPPYNQQPNVISFPANPAHESYLRSSSFPLIQQTSFVTNPPATPPGVSTGYPVVDRSAKPHDDNSRPYVLTSLGDLQNYMYIHVHCIVEPLYDGHHWDQQTCPFNRGVLCCGII